MEPIQIQKHTEANFQSWEIIDLPNSLISFQHGNVCSLLKTSESYFMEKEPPVSFPVSGSKKASFRQQSVGKPTSYLIPTIFINSCSWVMQNNNKIKVYPPDLLSHDLKSSYTYHLNSYYQYLRLLKRKCWINKVLDKSTHRLFYQSWEFDQKPLLNFNFTQKQ